MALIDIGLPDMDGRDLIRVFHNTCPSAPIFLMTGHKDVDAGKLDFITGILRKPFPMTAIKAALGTLLYTEE